MNISAPFILRPVATALLAVAVLLCGLLGYWRLPVSAMPQPAQSTGHFSPVC